MPNNLGQRLAGNPAALPGFRPTPSPLSEALGVDPAANLPGALQPGQVTDEDLLAMQAFLAARRQPTQPAQAAGGLAGARSLVGAIPAPNTPFSLLGAVKGAGTGMLDLMEAGRTATRPEDIPPSAALAVPFTGAALGAALAPRAAVGVFGGRLGRNIRPSKEGMSDLLGANFTSGRIIGDEIANIDDLIGGVRLSDPSDAARVNALAKQMQGPEGFFERIVVDTAGNVVEGQHRLEAARQLGLRDIPIVRVGEAAEGLPIKSMFDAVKKVGGLQKEQIDQVVANVGDMIRESGSAKAALEEFELPQGFEKPYRAALAAAAPRGALAAGAAIPKFARAGRTSKFTLDDLGGDRGLEVLVNPNRQQIERFTKPERFSFANNEVRILKDPETGDVYAWRAGGATHHQVAEELGIDLFDPRVNQSVGNSVGPSHPAFNRSGKGLQTSANPPTAAIGGLFGMAPQQERAAIERGDLL